MNLPPFTDEVSDNGYRWWYIDASSDDSAHALTAIIFIGSVFSPYYARARMRNKAQPAIEHCAVNVALYGPIKRWCMTERTGASVQARSHQLCIGRSSLQSVDGKLLTLHIRERSMPQLLPIRGRLEIDLPQTPLKAHGLDSDRNTAPSHYWQPVAPQTRIKVHMESPALTWQGKAYVDSNSGSRPLESSFRSWTWSRSHADNGDTTVLYDVLERDGRQSERSLLFKPGQEGEAITVEQRIKLPDTRFFRIPRQARLPSGSRILNLQTLEDTPFYSRSRYTLRNGSSESIAFHESLDLDRFDTSWVRTLLPFRMPRITRAVR